MRVSEQMIYNSLIDYMQKNTDALLQPQQEIASGKKINRPSDDPLGFTKVVSLNAMKGKLNQYLRNQDAAQSFMEATNSALDQASKILSDIKSVALNAASGLTPQSQQYDSNLLAGNMTSLLEVANTSFQGEYLFGGFKNGALPYNSAGVYQGDGGQIMTEIGPGATVQRNLPGQDVFGTALGGVDIFATIQALQTAINSNNPAGIQAALAPLDTAQQQILNAQGIQATRVVSLDSTRDYVKNLSHTTTTIRSQLEDADMATVITQFNAQQTALQAVQAMASKVMNLNLVNFLK